MTQLHVVPGLCYFLSMFFSMKLQLRQLKPSNLKKDTIALWKYPTSGELTLIALKVKFSSELRCCLASEHMEYSRQFIWTHFILLLWCIYVIFLSLTRAFFRSSPFMFHIINSHMNLEHHKGDDRILISG